MGLAEAIGKLFMKVFKPTGWEQHLTLEQINEMEKQGCDVTEIRQRYEDRVAAEAAAKKKLVDDSLAVVDISMLEKYKLIPRELDSDFVQDVALMGGKKYKWKERLPVAPLVYGCIVQAHWALLEPTEYERLGMVVLFAMDEKHRYDIDWLKETSKKIMQMKNSANVPKDNDKFIKTLRDDQSMFCFKLGESLSGDADAWCATYTVRKRNADILPLNYLPVTKILPMLVSDYPKVNRFTDLELIPAKYYTKSI